MWSGEDGKEPLVATDYAKLSENLRNFYDFSNKIVLYIGAGTRQLLDVTRPKKVIAVDKDAATLRELQSSLAERDLHDNVEVVVADFKDVAIKADVVYFEFCLHEMTDPYVALAHAKTLAPDVIVYDHSARSEWSYYAAEEDKVRNSSAIIHRFGIRRRQTYKADQRFADHAELLAKVGAEGPLAIERARRFADTKNIVIPMDYELDLL